MQQPGLGRKVRWTFFDFGLRNKFGGKTTAAGILSLPELPDGFRCLMALTFWTASAWTRVLRLTELPVALSKAYHMPQERLNFRYRCYHILCFHFVRI